MKSYLSNIARTYIVSEADNLRNYCFVFPNRRAGAFFHHYLLQEARGKSFIMPRIVTFNELASEATTLIEADRNEQLFAAYEAYSSLQPQTDEDDGHEAQGIVDFDKFLYWGSILIDDFNDVDSNLLDAEKLFVNIERWKEIKSDYLTADQIEVIRQYWGDDIPFSSVEEFWEHTATKSSRQFLRLWEVMNELYKRFTDMLRNDGMATRGMILREACYRIDNDETAFPMQRYIFIGFDLLSGAERHIFKTLNKLGKADFYWDFNTLLNKDKKNKLTKIFNNYRRLFPSRYDIAEPEPKLPDVKIVGVPGNTGMARWAGQILQQWADNGAIANVDNAVDTAVVLPDESLFIPMIHSVDESFENINVTMGFPLKLTPVSSLIRTLVSLHLRSRKRTNGIVEFYYEDVENVVTSTLVHTALPDECDGLLSDIRSKKLYTVSDEYIEEHYSPLTLFLDTSLGITDNKSRDAYNYIRRVLAKLLETTADNPSLRLDALFLESYDDAVQSLYTTISDFDFDMSASTFFHLAERMISTKTVSFQGKPLRGLQIMGVLETRCLDFDNIVMTSMNDKVFPQKAARRTFIPDAIRVAYGLATAEILELRFAYYFFRLISRANNVTFLYDTREGTNSGEISRMLTQLLYIYDKNGGIEHKAAVFSAMDLNSESVCLEKTPEIKRRLAEFIMPGGSRSLSPSAMKTYLSCPLHFALRYLVRLNPDDEINDYMESSVFGQVVHEVAENLYQNLDAHIRNNITDSVLDDLITNKRNIDRLITESINKHFKKSTVEHDLTPHVGESRVIGNTIRKIITRMLETEKQYTPFRFVAAEKRLDTVWPASDSLRVRFTQILDRLDYVDGRLRIVDYKTGDEKLKFGSIEDMFSVGVKNEAKSIFQVLMYCHLYRLHEKDDQPIQPYIYQLHDLFTNGLNPISMDKDVLTDYHVIDTEFTDSFNALLEKIFHSDEPFTQAEDKENCKFCKFKEICNVVVTE